MSGHSAPSHSRKARHGLAGLLFALALGGCGGGSEEAPCLFFCPPPNGSSIHRTHVVGIYDALRFELDDEDLLAGGAEVTLALQEDGGTAGRLFVPGGAEEGEDLDADLAGSWTYSGYDGVRLTHEADTFLRDIYLHASREDDRADGKIVLWGAMDREGGPRLSVTLRQR